VDANLLEQLRITDRPNLDQRVTMVPASDTILESTLSAHDEGEQWLAATRAAH